MSEMGLFRQSTAPDLNCCPHVFPMRWISGEKARQLDVRVPRLGRANSRNCEARDFSSAEWDLSVGCGSYLNFVAQ